MAILIFPTRLNLREMKVNATKDIKVHVDKISFNFRDNGHHRPRPSGLGSGSTVVVRQ